jgi:hypothetical protein
MRETDLLTRLLEHVDPLSDDPLIVVRLMGIGHEQGLGGEPVPIGIRNADGRVYRLLLVVGVGETLRVLRLMQQLGFAEEDRRSPAEGCQLTFRRHAGVPQQGAWQANFQPSVRARAHARSH